MSEDLPANRFWQDEILKPKREVCERVINAYDLIRIIEHLKQQIDGNSKQDE